MKKIFLFIILISILSLFVVFFYNKYEYKNEKERIYSIASYYSYLSTDDTILNFSIFSNKDDSLIRYADKADAKIISDNSYLDVEIKDVNLKSSTQYNNELLYEYIINVAINSNDIILNDAYLVLEFDNIKYQVYLGVIEIEDFNLYNPVNYTPKIMYGLSFSEPYLSLGGIYLTLSDKEGYLMDISIGNSFKVSLNEKYKALANDSNQIEDYTTYIYNQEAMIYTTYLKKDEGIIIPIYYHRDLFISNCYVLFLYEDVYYYIPNFIFIDTNDLNELKRVVRTGSIVNV